MQYILIKAVLVIGLLLVAFFMMRPVKSASHLALRRIGMMIIVIAAALAVIFPETLNGLARMIGVASGVNLVVYFLVIVVFAQMATSYRRDMATERKITDLARALALQSTQKPNERSGSGGAPIDNVDGVDE
ncbi:DUF2304 domain-containing protein [Actinomycetaceae bacterium WB03_NA08]|uniref:DUF2304 domain-containing protein n=1 Tax=Scrofimicrobium canadense TaxID=2652290 RepID=A0A6N7W5P6_9ACTO|nr:DUF2304 domain-containing protein [Scrofimicrobium canadense]MSS83458.1 DUF2304 domain-containing protein [Scrofimicrobium canadense]